MSQARLASILNGVNGQLQASPAFSPMKKSSPACWIGGCRGVISVPDERDGICRSPIVPTENLNPAVQFVSSYSLWLLCNFLKTNIHFFHIHKIILKDHVQIRTLFNLFSIEEVLVIQALQKQRNRSVVIFEWVQSILHRVQVVADSRIYYLFCWSSPWQPEPWTNKPKRHVTTDTGRSSAIGRSRELHC